MWQFLSHTSTFNYLVTVISVKLLVKMSAAGNKGGHLTSEQALIFPVIFQVFLTLCPTVYKSSMNSISAGQNRIYNLLTEVMVLPLMLRRKHSLAHVVTKCITGGLIS
jgi:hypothetical protein